MKLLKHQFLIRYTALQLAEMLQLKKKLQKDISFHELVVEQEKLENVKLAASSYQSTTMIKFVANA
jgi:hypothetical protein